MTGRVAWVVAGMLVLGAAVRLLVSAETHGVLYDIQQFIRMNEVLSDGNPFDVYSQVNRGRNYTWPYPPGFLPLIWGCARAATRLGIEFGVAIRQPAIAADVVLGGLVALAAARRGAGAGGVIGGAALLALSPVLILVSSRHGQIDSVAVAPALAAVIVWGDGAGERGRRAVLAGLLMGLAATIKTPMALTAAILLPFASSWREAVRYSLAAAAVPAAALAPFLASDAGDVLHAFGYPGISGPAGLAVVADPSLARAWTQTYQFRGSGLLTAQKEIVALVLVAVSALAWRRRLRPVDAVALMFAGLWVLSPAFTWNYLVWGLPFLALAGHVRACLAIQAAATPPMLLFYSGRLSDPELTAYVIAAILAWIVFAAVAAWLLRPALLRRPDRVASCSR